MNTSPKLLIITIVGLVGYWTIPSILYWIIAFEVNVGLMFSQEIEDYFSMTFVYLTPILMGIALPQAAFNPFAALPGMTFAIVITTGISLGWTAYGSYRLIKRVNRFRNKVNNP